MRRIVLGLLAAASVAAPFAAQSASAEDICVTVTTQGTATGTHAISKCQPYNHDVTCVDRDVSFDPRADVYAKACIPT